MATSASSACFLRTNRLSDARAIQRRRGEKHEIKILLIHQRECGQFARRLIEVEGRRGQSDAAGDTVTPYRRPTSWFPVVAEHQLQVDGFTLLHLLLQLVLTREEE